MAHCDANTGLSACGVCGAVVRPRPMPLDYDELPVRRDIQGASK